MRKDWISAAHLVGRISVGLGLILVAAGCFKIGALYVQSHRGIETLATIESTARRGLTTGGWVDVSWRDTAGTLRQAFGVPVTYRLARKLRLGSELTRAHLRIRYQPDKVSASIVVIEDVPEQIKSAAALSMAGFIAISAGSLAILALLLYGWEGGAALGRNSVRTASPDPNLQNQP